MQREEHEEWDLKLINKKFDCWIHLRQIAIEREKTIQ